jgi:hypothetical protein
MKRQLAMLTALALLLFGQTVQARQRIAVFNFELNDITSLPNTVTEQQRTASIRPLLEQALLKTGDDYEIVDIDSATETLAKSGVGYLFAHPDWAAQMGQRLGVDWLIVGQHSKPSFLFSYLKAQLIQVAPQRLAASFDIEMKGNHVSVTEHGTAALALKIHRQISTAAANKSSTK